MSNHYRKSFDWAEDYDACTRESIEADERAKARYGQTPLYYDVIHKRLTLKGKLRKLFKIKKPREASHG